MKKLILPLLLVLVLGACQKTNKTAFVDNERLMKEYKERQDLEKAFLTKQENFTKKKDSLARMLQQEADLIQDQGKSLSETEKAKLLNAFTQKRNNLGVALNNESKQISEEGQQMIDSLLDQMEVYLEEYAKEKGFAYIFAKNKAGGILYGAPSDDITDAVIESMNKKYSGRK